MLRVGRFRFLFTITGSEKAVRWYGFSVGIESSWSRAWKKKIRKVNGIESESHRAWKLPYHIKDQMRNELVKECIYVILMGMAIGSILRWLLG